MATQPENWPTALRWLLEPAQAINGVAREQALAHQAQLTKPAGALGQLEEIAVDFAGWQGRHHPTCEKIAIRIFAADHGVAARGVSAFPQAVTAQMVNNFATGGGAINILSRQLQADFALISLGTVAPIDAAPVVIERRIAAQTRDFCDDCAMSEEQLWQATEVGRTAIANLDCDLFVGGEMGIGNTTSASAIYCCLLGVEAEDTVGPGTGVKAEALDAKIRIVRTALERHLAELPEPPPARALEALRCVGGFETASLAASYIACAQRGIPAVVDGFICTAAALVAVRINPSVREWLAFGHESAEPAHHVALKSLDATPLLNLNMRLGEGSGAALAARIIQSALALHNEMATFASAGVSQSG